MKNQTKTVFIKGENEEVPPRWVKIYKKEVSRGGKHFLLFCGTFLKSGMYQNFQNLLLFF